MDWEVLTTAWKKQNLPPWLGPQYTTLLLTIEEENDFFNSLWHKITMQMWLKLEVGEGIDYPEEINITDTAQLHY